MKTGPRRFAFIGLILAGLGLLLAVGALLVKGFALAGFYLPPNPQLLNNLALAGLALVLLGLSLFAILDPERTRALITGRQARRGSNAAIVLLAVTGILIFVNLIVYENPKSWDLTASKQNTLAPETLKTLASLPEPVKAIGFFTSRMPNDTAKTLLEKYKRSSNGKFDYSFVDPEADPAQAQAAQITEDGTIALYLRKQKELVTTVTEQELTGALVRLMNPEQKVVYFLGGHGELQAVIAGDKAYTSARQVLESKNYTVQALNLIEEAKVPADAKVVVIPGPQTSLSADEIAKLKDFLAKGGGLIVMEEPPLLTKMAGQPDLLVDMLKSDWGITLANDMVIDPAVNPPLGAATLPTQPHPITQSIQNVDVLFPTARSITVAQQPSGVTITDLGSTGASAWGDNNYSTSNPQLVYDANVDTPGPLQIAVAGENSATGGRVVVFGDSEFADDTNFNQYGNRDMFINSVDWAAGQEKLISLTPYSAEQRTFQPPSPLATVGLIVLAVCVVPLLILVAGVWTWMARRRRG